MSVQGPDSLPVPGYGDDAADPPNLEQLRIALRPPELPAPTPHDALSAAHRVMDLLHAERFGEAAALAEECEQRTRFQVGPDAARDRLELLQARLISACYVGGTEAFEHSAADLVGHLRRHGYRAHAAAAVMLLPRTGTTSPSRGRRRGSGTPVPDDLLAVLRGLRSPLLRAPGDSERFRLQQSDPHAEVRELRAALAALPHVRELLLGDPEPQLMVRLAQALEGTGELSAATSLALDVLERMEQADADGSALPDPQRARTSAHAVLSRTLRDQQPVLAARHAIQALLNLRTVDDPPLRIGLITDLLHAQMAAGLGDHASFTAGRLLSLQRTLHRDAHRIGPLLAVADQRIGAERYEPAWVPLEEARAIARRERDRWGSLEAARLAASIHERTGETRKALVELRKVAAEAHWLADDLLTADAERSQLVLTELQAQSLVMRRALDLGETALALSAAAQVERRTRPEGGRPVLPVQVLWDHRVDALVGRFIAVAAAVSGDAERQCVVDAQQRRREAQQAIDDAPPGHHERARYWTDYLQQRAWELLGAR